jgi:hypothetical protein
MSSPYRQPVLARVGQLIEKGCAFPLLFPVRCASSSINARSVLPYDITSNDDNAKYGCCRPAWRLCVPADRQIRHVFSEPSKVLNSES